MSIFFGAGGGGSGQAQQATAWIPLPEVRVFATTIEGGGVSNEYSGGSFVIEEPVSFNRVAIRLTNIPAAATALGRFLIYQRSDGGIGDTIPLIGSFDFEATEPPSTVVIESALNEGTVELVRGVCWALWGARAGDGGFNITAYQVAEGNVGYLLNFVPVSGTHPVTFTTNVDTATAPSTLNPLAGGGTVSGVPDDKAIVWRVFTV